DRPRDVARRFGLVPAALSGTGDRQEEPLRDDRCHRRRPARRDCGDEGARHALEPEARYLRRARGRSVVDSVLREGRTRLRELLAVSRAGRPAGCGAGGARGQGRGLITIYKHEGGSTQTVDRVDPAWIK